MSNIVVIAGKNHELLRKFFNDRGTMDYITSYENIHENENVLLMGTYEVDKLIYVNQNEDLEVQKDMVSLTRIIKSDHSFLTVDEVIIFSLKNDLYEKLYDTARVAIEKESIVNHNLKVPRFIINTLDKPISFDGIYTKVLGIVRAEKTKVEYRVLYREERDKRRDDLYDRGDFTDVNYTPFDFKEVSDYDRLKNLFRETDVGEFLIDPAEKEKSFLNIDLNRFSYHDSRKSKTMYFVGDRRVGTTTHLLSVAVSLLLTGKSVTVIDLSLKPDVVKILDTHAIPYNLVEIQELVSNAMIPVKNKINVIDNFVVSNSDFIKWMKVNSIEARTDFILVDFPSTHKEWLEDNTDLIIRIEEMEELSLSKFKSISGKDLVLLSSIFEIERTCEAPLAKEFLSKGVSKIIAPLSLSLSDVKVTLAEEILREV